jgi:L-alanine-DL-glutamate epimerase-like enolase superfamily enzyme
MKITSLETIILSIPFTDGSKGTGIMPSAWTDLDFALVRIETDTGLVGWGEGFGYYCNKATAAIINRSIAPLVVGRELGSPPEMCEEIQRKMVLQGRYGISTFALSGVDIALWDLAAKAQGVSVAQLLGTRIRETVPAYASLVRYADEQSVEKYSLRALEEGYEYIKLHEIDMPSIRACRRSIGTKAEMIVDVNCNWTESFARDAIAELKELNTYWLEEPIFPPEDFETLARLRKEGLALAAGENACTAFQFEAMMKAGAVDYLQPSITKVGGISEFMKIGKINRDYQLAMMPHSPYFGPGYLATLQMAAAEQSFDLFEYLYIWPQAWLYKEMPLPHNGLVAIPEGAGLGMDPDLEMINRYRVK